MSKFKDGRSGWGAGPAALAGAFAVMLTFTAVASAADFVVVGSRTSTGTPVVRTFADNAPSPRDGVYEKLVDEMIPYRGPIGDAVRVATGDFNGDGNDELVTATNRSSPVKIFELGSDGEPGPRIDSEPGFAHGTYVAAGDTNNDGIDELITSGGPGDQEVVKIRSDTNGDGKPNEVVDTFNAYPVERAGGVRVAAGDVNNTGGAEVITAPGPDNLPVKVWSDSDADRAVSDNALLEQFKPFGPNFAGGMFVASGPFQSLGNGGAELILSRADGAGKTVLRSDTDSDGKVSDNPPVDSIASPYPGSTKGARIAAGDTDHSSFFTELITAPGEKTGTNPVKIYDDSADADAKISDNPVTQSFTAFPGNEAAYVAFARVPTNNVFLNTFPQTIADNSTLNTTITVPGSAGLVSDLDVTLDIVHSFDGDLDVTLTHVPTGKSVVLFEDVGGSNEGFEIRLNDEAGTDITTATNPKADGVISGTFNPGGAALLSLFDGDDASGQWRLTIVDDSGGDSGTLMTWGLNFTY